MIRPALIACAALMVGGCELLGFQLEREPTDDTVAQDPAAILLAEAALQAEAALAALAQARAAENPAQAQPPPRLVPEELFAEVTLDWIGPLQTLAADLASRAGFTFIEAGTRPPAPFIVQVSAEAAHLILVLRDAGIQAAGAATLTVDAPAREVRLDWAPLQGDLT